MSNKASTAKKPMTDGSKLQASERKSETNQKTGKEKGRRRRRAKAVMEDRPLLEPNAAAIDIGARQMFVAVPPDRDDTPVRVFDTFTEDLNLLADWLVECGITTVAMESTGVYWIPVYEILEKRGIRACVVNARHMKNVPGKRTDWQESQWLQYLHSVGLLRAAFRPQAEVCALRTIMRHRGELVQMAAQHVQHMHKALTQMNVQIHHVISDLTGTTGLAIIDAMVSGESDVVKLAKLKDPRIKASKEVIQKSLVGNWSEEHLFTLKQSRRMYGEYQSRIAECDTEIERRTTSFQPRVDPQTQPLPVDRKKSRNYAKNRNKRAKAAKLATKSSFDLRTETYKLFGVDVTQIPGLEYLALQLFSEIGRDMSRWPTVACFISWLSLCPDNDKSGGRVLWRGNRKACNRAGQLFRMAAYGLDRSHTPMGDYLRKMKGRLGPPGAYLATAHKIARIFYTIVKNQVEYDHTIWDNLDDQRRQRHTANLQRQAKRLGFDLVPAAQRQEVA